VKRKTLFSPARRREDFEQKHAKTAKEEMGLPAALTLYGVEFQLFSRGCGVFAAPAFAILARFCSKFLVFANIRKK
jgi:hypothetical protein